MPRHDQTQSQSQEELDRLRHNLEDSTDLSPASFASLPRLMENAPDLVIVTASDASIIYVNRVGRLTLGYSTAEAGRLSLSNITAPRRRSAVLEVYQKLSRGEKTSLWETELLTRDKKTLPVEGNLHGQMQEGKLFIVCAIFRNISERRHRETKVQKAYAREKKLRCKLEEEMKRRIEFTRAMVHELKTPLTPILLSSELLIAERPPEPLFSLAGNINRGASSLNKRIDELLDLAKGEVGLLRLVWGQVDVGQLLRRAAGEMGTVAQSHGQQLILEVPPTIPALWADERRLREVVFNLLSNACKFTPEGGHIALRAQNTKDEVTVSVTDTGPGISREDQHHLFKPYSRLEKDQGRYGGLGLGLALSKKHIELHGGQIWVRSQKGQGSTFGFSIPLNHPPPVVSP
jgi:PAS domain S-box-containing protein